MRSILSAALLACLAASSSGCSLLFTTKAPSPVLLPEHPIDCTDSVAAPVLDTICAAYFAANGIYLATLPDCANAGIGQSCFSSSAKTGGILLSVGLLALCAGSAVSGYSSTAQCR